MPGKSKRKQMRYATRNQVNTVQSPVEATTAVKSAGAAATPTRPQAAVKAAQYTPALLEHVGSELRMTLILSGTLVAAIIVLYFVLR